MPWCSIRCATSCSRRSSGKGAQLNGAPIRVSSCTALDTRSSAPCFPTRESPQMPALPAAVQRAGRALRRRPPRRRVRARPRHVAAGTARRLLGDEPQAVGRRARARCSSSEAGGRVGDFAGGSEFLRTNEVIAAAPGMFNPLREAIAAARRRVTPARAARTRRGNSATASSVTSAIAAIASSSVRNPAALTTGPSSPHRERAHAEATRSGASRTRASASGRRRSGRSSRR